MNAIELIAQDLFDKVRSRYSNLEMGDEEGNVTADPRKARFFDFNYVLEGTNLGRVSISINQRGTLKVFYGQGILEGHDEFVSQSWFNFLREMRMFAKRRLLRFDTRDITKSNLDKSDFQYLASTGSKEDNMSESKMFGSSRTSYRPLEKTRLIIRHNKPVDEGQRHRHINALYVENSEGERFKYPFIHLAGAKAMQRHVANGGRPHDEHGLAIIGISEEIAKLHAFKRHVGKADSMQSEAHDIISRADQKLNELRDKVNKLSRQGYYEAWKETVSPDSGDQMVMDQATMEDYKSKFTVSTFAEDLTEYFPLLHKIMQETSEVDLVSYVGENSEEKCNECGMFESSCTCGDEKEVKEFAEFVEWAENVTEGRLSSDQIASLQDLLNNETKTGLDGTNAIQSLHGIGIEDDELDDMITKAGPEGDLKTIVAMWLNHNGDTDAVDKLGLDKTSGEPVAPEQAPAAPEQSPEAPEQTAAEDEDLDRSPEKEGKLNIRDVAEMVKSFYDRETGKFPLGETGVAIKVEKELGPRAGMLAKQLILKLSGGDHEEEKPHNDLEQQAFEDILRLSGLK